MVVVLKTKEEFDKQVLNADPSVPVVIDFTATWCGPCKMMAPVFEKMAEVYKDMVFLKVDVDENEEAAAFAEVSAMPTFQVYKGGKKVETLVGANKDKLEEMCKNFSAK